VNVGTPTAADLIFTIPQGADGIDGIDGTNGLNGVSDFAGFYAVMPGDNTATVAPGTAVQFPNDGPAAVATGITRVPASPSAFNLAAIGTYQISFQVSVSEAGQLVLNGTPGGQYPPSVAGRATGTSQIVNTFLFTTTIPNTVISIHNPVGNPVALTITPTAGGSTAVGAQLTILRVA
jgi:hypothetical protein